MLACFGAVQLFTWLGQVCFTRFRPASAQPRRPYGADGVGFKRFRSASSQARPSFGSAWGGFKRYPSISERYWPIFVKHLHYIDYSSRARGQINWGPSGGRRGHTAGIPQARCWCGHWRGQRAAAKKGARSGGVANRPWRCICGPRFFKQMPTGPPAQQLRKSLPFHFEVDWPGCVPAPWLGKTQSVL